MTEDIKMKLLVVGIGDGAVGKTCLILTYLRKEFPEQYDPTVVDNYHTSLPLKGGNKILLDIWDSYGMEDIEAIRKLFYANTDVIMICYNCVSLGSFGNVESIWTREATYMAPGVPFILCGTKADLINTYPELSIAEDEGLEMSARLKAFASIQCSAKNYKEDSTGVIFAFTRAITAHLENIENKLYEKNCCTLL